MTFARGRRIPGHPRTGSLRAGPDERAASRAQRVEPVCSVVAGRGREIATPGEACAMPGLKGAAGVGF